RHFDRWERERVPLALVISGSALSMMEQLLEGGRPMFGRAGYRPFLQLFDYRDASLFAGERSVTQKLQRYGVLGGTAQYQVWAGDSSIQGIIPRKILTKDESLFEEPLQLIRGESAIREPGNYYEVLRSIARGATQFNEILQRSKAPSGQLLTSRLERLATLGYIAQGQSLGGNGSTSWSVSDPFFRFWFRYVYPNRSRLQRGRVEEVCEAILADLDNHMGSVFEQVCRDWAGRYSTDTALAGAEEIGAYWTRTHDVEVDLIARDRKGVLAVGSCKWSAQANTHDLDRLIELRGRIRGAGNATPYVFARDFHPALLQRAERERIRLVSADELFSDSATNR